MPIRRLSAGLAAVALTLASGSPAASGGDPREGLRGGYDHEGVAARGLEIVGQAKLPPGFDVPQAKTEKPAARPTGPLIVALNYSNSDMGFSGNRLVVGNYHGINIYDVADPRRPRHVVAIVCPGGQHDVAVYGNLVFLAVQSTRARLDCGESEPASAPDPQRFLGVRIFDISRIDAPRQVAAVQTCEGSHTLTLVPDRRDPGTLYVYNSGSAAYPDQKAMRPDGTIGLCSSKSAEEDPNTSRYSIDVIKVPLAAPEKAAIVSIPRLFEIGGRIDGIATPQRPDAQQDLPADNCHDITAYPEIDLAAAACLGAGLLLDISDPAHPRRIDWTVDKNFGAWHSATFSNDGRKLVFTDEFGYGAEARCQRGDPPFWGGDGFWTIEQRKLVVQGYFKIPQVQSALENCTTHNGNLIPVPGRDILIQAWYQGGVSAVDFTDPVHPREIAFLDHGYYGDGKTPALAGYWSSYWHNGYVYNTDIRHGVDILRLVPTADLTRNEIAAAELVREEESNPQTQTRIHWPDSPVVARAFLDQLVREKAISTPRRQAVEAALSRIERRKGLGKAFDPLVATLKADGAAATEANRLRFEGIARILSL